MSSEKVQYKNNFWLFECNNALTILYIILLFFSVVGQDNTGMYIDISEEEVTRRHNMFEVLVRSGFANKTHGEYKLLPCGLGTFVNSSISDPSKIRCLECPAGKFCPD